MHASSYLKELRECARALREVPLLLEKVTAAVECDDMTY